MAEGTVFDDDEEVIFLTIAQVINLHEDAIRHYSPTESLRILDQVTFPRCMYHGQCKSFG